MKKSIEQLNREANRALAQYRKARNVTTLLLIAIILSGIMVAIIYSL
jgi:t-SNARE complex subunit (syntaxin)|tara:strand:- start:106 stop:246 length:141 start_codon:yes stop_codon:yes gene_type:complete